MRRPVPNARGADGTTWESGGGSAARVTLRGVRRSPYNRRFRALSARHTPRCRAHSCTPVHARARGSPGAGAGQRRWGGGGAGRRVQGASGGHAARRDRGTQDRHGRAHCDGLRGGHAAVTEVCAFRTLESVSSTTHQSSVTRGRGTVLLLLGRPPSPRVPNRHGAAWRPGNAAGAPGPRGGGRWLGSPELGSCRR